MQTQFPAVFSFILIISLLLSSCSDEPQATLVLSVSPGGKVKTGQTITLDAGQSEYDKITWKMDGYIYGKCNTRPICALKYDVPDNKTIWVEVSMDHRAHWTGMSRSRTTKDTAGLRLSWVP